MRLSPSPAELLQAAAKGDAAAWHELVERYHRLVWSVARGYGLNQHDAADVSQTTWLRLVENLGRIREPDNLASWLATTARRECAKLARHTQREAPSEQPADESAIDPDEGADPAAAAVRGDEHSRLWAAFRDLGERCQQLLRVLAVSPQDSYAEVAAALDMPVGSIGPTRLRCLTQLKRLLAETTTHDAAGTGA